jgi:hypothetical protein
VTYVSEHDRYPESRPPDLFLAAARVLCGEEPSMRDALWGSLRMSYRRHPLDVAHDALVREVREVLGDRALPCNCLRSLVPDYEGGHTLGCLTRGDTRAVEQSHRAIQRVVGEVRALWHPPLVAERYPL